MNYFEKLLLIYLQTSKLETKITGLDMEGFQKALKDEGKRRLEIVEQIVFEDSDLRSDAQKVAALKLCFQKDFYS